MCVDESYAQGLLVSDICVLFWLGIMGIHFLLSYCRITFGPLVFRVQYSQVSNGYTYHHFRQKAQSRHSPLSDLPSTSNPALSLLLSFYTSFSIVVRKRFNSHSFSIYLVYVRKAFNQGSFFSFFFCFCFRVQAC